MKYKILLVDDCAEVGAASRQMLAERWDLRQVAGAEEAWAQLQRQGPFAAVLCAQDLPDERGADFLRTVRERWPDTVRVLLARAIDVEVAVSELNQGRIFRFVQKPCTRNALRRTLEEAAEEYERRTADREYKDQLILSRDTLIQFTGALEKRVSSQTRTLARLHRFAIGLNAASSLQQITRLAAEAAHDVLDARAVEVELWEPRRGTPPVRSRVGGSPSRERLLQPVASRDGRVGSIKVDRADRRGGVLSDNDRHMLASIASSAAVATHSRIRTKQRDEAQQATILALATLAERRDNETGKHLERVSRYCELVAAGLREDGLHVDLITDEWVRDLFRSAPLHDIGKVGIPDSILLKPGGLSTEEWEIMKTHTDIGAQTLRSVMRENEGSSFLEMSLDIAWCHHEKWDGTGYPRGLVGAQIPLTARILALADVYDALTTVRPYKPSWTHERAVAWISSKAGSHFDADVVDAFLVRQEEADAVRATLADSAEESRSASLPLPAQRTA